MVTICPTVLAKDPHEFREQMERIAPFAERIQIDLTDGHFASHKTLGLEHVWWPVGIQADLHLMYKNPLQHIEAILKLEPHLVIIHAEADGDFYELANALKAADIKVGVALLPETPVRLLAEVMTHIDHILIFSGSLGHFGGRADLSLLGKISEAKALKSDIEVGWDGGVNEHNIKTLVHNGVDVLNVGGFIQNSERPQEAYATLKKIASEAKIHETETGA